MKKIISLFLSLMLIMSTVSVLAEEDKKFTYNEKEYSSAVSIMTGLLKERVFSENIERNITREEFVAGVTKIFGIEPQDGKSIYTDISDSEYIGEIIAANQFGLVASAEYFYPKSEITAQEAATIIDRALNYINFAEQFGGYPKGYMYVAQDMGLFDNTNVYLNTDNISVADACIMFKNIMFAPTYDVSAKGGNISYNKTDKTYIEDKYDVYKFEGQVTSAGNHSLVMEAPTRDEENYLEIDGQNYIYEQNDINLLGKMVYAYGIKGSGNIVWLEERKYKEITMEEDIDIEINNQTLKYTQNNKSVNVKLDKAYKVIYNGRRSEKFEDYMIDDATKVRLLDCGNDGVYDIIFIDKYIYGYVTGVDWVNKQIGIKVPGETIDISDESNIECYVYNSENAEIELFELESQNVVSILKSEDGVFYSIKVCDEAITGTVKSISKDKITVNDKEFEYTTDFKEEFVDTDKIKIGKEATLFLGLEGQIVYMSMINGASHYGYMKNVFIEEGSEKVGIKIYTQSGMTEEFDLADKVNVDGKKVKNNEALYTLLQSKGVMGVVKYCIDDNNKIKEILYPEKAIGVMKSYTDLTDGFYQYYDNEAGQLTYRGGPIAFNSKAIISSSTVLVIPTNESDMNDDYKYSFGSRSLLVSATKYTVDIYDVDEYGMAGFVVVNETYDNSASNQTVSSYIISDIEKSYNEEEGEVMTLLECYADGKFQEVYVPYDLAISKTSGEELCIGDIVRMKVVNGIARAVYVDYDYSSGMPVYEPKGKATHTDVCEATCAYTDGGIYNFGTSSIILSKNKNEAGDIIYENIDLMPYQIGTNIVCFDSEDKSVRPISSSSIHSYIGYGADADYAVIRQNYGTTNNVFVYR